MKIILVELPNEVPDELLEGLADAIRNNLQDHVDYETVVRFGGIYTT